MDSTAKISFKYLRDYLTLFAIVGAIIILDQTIDELLIEGGRKEKSSQWKKFYSFFYSKTCPAPVEPLWCDALPLGVMKKHTPLFE